eukprot:5007843-Amphidinium_carterae.4
METSLSLQQVQDLEHVEQQAQTYYRSRWIWLKQEARLEYSRVRSSQLNEVGRFETNLERDRVHLELQELQTSKTALQEELAATQRNLQTATHESYQREEQLVQQLQENHVVHQTDQDLVLRTELASAQDNIANMTATRLRMTRANQRLEQSEASAREIKVCV